MVKNFVRLLTICISFLVLLVAPKIAKVASQSDLPPVEAKSQLANNLVDLNTYSPSLERLNQSSNFLFAHLGCNCGVCTQQLNQPTNS